MNATPYSSVDRAIHRLAFSSAPLQEIVVDIEKALYRAQFSTLEVKRPIFITSLPRAGTTLVLELLAQLPGIATHTYRDMPFVMAPLLWNTISRPFRKSADLRERAHGDGMEVGYDSPEAFEEILWRTAWKNKYRTDRILLWSDREEAKTFLPTFVDHIRKILALRVGRGQVGRYASKNNANIARLGMLQRMFADGLILVPFRDPVGQAASLLQQHTRFTALHKEDSIARQYMDDIGHLEFGALHRPIQFEGMDDVRSRYRPETLAYWVAYWECAFRHVLAHHSAVTLMSYESLCARGPTAVPVLAARLSVPVDALTRVLSNRMRPPNDKTSDAEVGAPELVDRCRALHADLPSRCVLGNSAGAP